MVPRPSDTTRIDPTDSNIRQPIPESLPGNSKKSDHSTLTTDTSVVSKSERTYRGRPLLTKEDNLFEESTQAGHEASDYIVVFQNLIKNLHFLEQTTNALSSASQSLTVHSSRRAPTGIKKTLPTPLRDLTQSLLANKTNQPPTETAIDSSLRSLQNRQTPTKQNNEKSLKNFFADQSSNAAVGFHEPDRAAKLSAQTLEELLSTDSSQPLSASHKNTMRSVYSSGTNFTFRDIGRLETLKIADAVSDYLQEQASLHGVDLS